MVCSLNACYMNDFCTESLGTYIKEQDLYFNTKWLNNECLSVRILWICNTALRPPKCSSNMMLAISQTLTYLNSASTTN